MLLRKSNIWYSERHKNNTQILWAKLKVLNFKVCGMYRGADKSLARPGRKKDRTNVRDVRDFNNIETQAVIKFFSSYKAGRRRQFTPFWQKH